MRLLFAFAGGRGHLEPLLPLARASVARGHVVAFAGRPWMAPEVEALGFPAFSAGSDVGLTPTRRPLAALDVEREMRAVGPGFGERVARTRAADLIPLCAAWRPDLLVCEELDFGAMLVAERLGLPHATVLVTAAGSFVRPEFVAGPLDEVRAEHSLPPDPGLSMPQRYLVLSPFPASYRDPDAVLPDTAHAFRANGPDVGSDEAFPPLAELAQAARIVYFTLGTVFPVESGDLFSRVLAGLRELEVHVVVTLGPALDPAELGPLPAHVHVRRYVPQARLLPHCDLVVSHGGSGSVLGALAHGLPMLLLPMGADQPLNAARCEALGVAQVLDAREATPHAVREAVEHVRANPAYRRAAERLKQEIAGLPDPAHAVSLLERLAVERRPLPST